MKETKAMREARFLNRMGTLGFTVEETYALRRIEMTLSRWSELECGDSNDYASWAIERDEQTEKPYMVRHIHRAMAGSKNIFRHAIPDRERGAIKRLRALMAKHPDLWWFNQGDPRGCALYVGRWDVLPGGNAILPKYKDPELAKVREVLDSNYTRGVAVCF